MRTSRLTVLFVALLISGCNSTKHQAKTSTAPSFWNQVAAFAGSYKFKNVVEVGDVDAENMVASYKAIYTLVKAGETDLTLRIDSFGGSVFLGSKWIQMVEDLKKKNNLSIVCIVDGAAYSMGAVILESPICDLRLATKRSTILFHNASGSVEGTAEDMKQSAAFLEALNEAMAAMVAERIGMSVEDYRAKIHRQDWMMAVKEAMAMGVIDGLVHPNEIAPPSF